MSLSEPLVLKVGGSEGIDLDALCDDVAALHRDRLPLVLVHGGSAETNRVAEALGHPPQFITSPSGFTSRLTDRKALEIFEMVYCGSVNKGLVERLQARGVNAIGLSGLDGRIWEGKRKKSLRVVEDGKVRLPFTAIRGLGDAAAAALEQATMHGQEYISVEELQQASGVAQSVFDKLRAVGALGNLPETSQVDLFSMI